MRSWLVLWGWFAVVSSLLLILIPYIRRRNDLFNSWTLFHLGFANFMGIAAIQSGNADMHLYVQPQSEDYTRFVLGGIVFYTILVLTYYLFPLPRQLAGKLFTKWGPRTPKTMLWLIPVCLLMVVGYIFVSRINIQFLAQWMSYFGRYAGSIAIVFAMTAWAQRPFNISLAFITGLVVLVAVIAANIEFGRRDFLGVLVTVPLCWYWLRARYSAPPRVLMIVGLFIIVGGSVMAGVSVARAKRATPDMSVVQAAWAKVKAIPEAFRSTGSAESLFGGDAVDASLATIRLYDKTKQPEPFFTLKYILVHPIPRAWWPDKPNGLGYTLPIEIGWSGYHGAVNLGPGIIGHGFHEGGLAMLAFYGFLFAAVMKFYDSMLARDPGNPYLMGILGACAGQIIGFARGDIALFSVLIIGAFITGYVLSLMARIFGGTDRVVDQPMAFAIDPALEAEYGATPPHAPSWR